MEMVPVSFFKKANLSLDDNIKLDTFKDQAHVLNTFPEEVWSMVFENLTDSSDLENVCNASLFFRHLLAPKHVLFLFPKVWKILDLKYHQNGKEDPFQNTCEDFKIDGVPIKDYYKYCSSCFKYVDGWWNSTSLTFRLVCRSWNSTVETFYQVKPAGRISDEMHYSEIQSCTSHNSCFKFSYQNQAKSFKFMRLFDPTHLSAKASRNPFPCRAIDLYISEDIEEALNQDEEVDIHQPNWNESSLAHLLRKYGRHVWYCRLQAEDVLENYSRITDVLGWMPNLKQLFISSQYQNASLKQIEMKAFTTQTTAIPLPTLKFLKFLYIDGVLVVLINVLIHRYNKLEVLDLFDQQKELFMHQFQLPNLQTLSIELNKKSEFLSLTRNPVMWPLKKLYLGLEGSVFIDWPDMINKLEENWADTLTSLVLKSDRYKSIDQSQLSNLKLNFPSVISLELDIPNIGSLDCILPMKHSLEFLKLTHVYGDSGYESEGFSQGLENGKVIKFFRHSNKLWESNVWQEIPKLKRVELKTFYRTETLFAGHLEQTFICTRDLWKRSQVKVENVNGKYT